jgi:Ca2+-binding EF-hand superfamily protein
MRKILLAAAGAALLAGGAGLALAQQGSGGEGGRQFGLFQADANSDGAVTRQEFDAHRAARFASLDANHDGNLTREEMRAQRRERGERGHRGRRDHGGGMHSLARADANNDGNITREEFLARPTQMFDRLDANSDGVISTTERPQRPERGERRERANPDANGDGNFSQAEFMSMGASMFERLDANDDGRVTREEAEAARPHRRGQ